MSEIQRIIDEMIRKEVVKEFTAQVEKDLTPSSSWQGFTGIRGIFDEWEFFPALPPLSWTPDEFRRMWSTLTHESKIAYVKKLIT
jgi:hypothetical protein